MRAFRFGFSAESPQFCLRDDPVQLLTASPARDLADMGCETHAKEIEAIKGNHVFSSFYVSFDRKAAEAGCIFRFCLTGKSTALYSRAPALSREDTKSLQFGRLTARISRIACENVKK